ncbi:MAG: LCP family protein [Actinomycetaceae bacterium]|nr:LCP family protein [Actinomycetaceae bacterium]
MAARYRRVNYHRRPQHAVVLGRKSQVLSGIIASLLAVALFAGTASALLYHDISSSIKSRDISQYMAKGTQAPSDDFTGRSLNILVVGTDTRKGEGNAVDNYQDDSSRSDTTFVIHISADRKDATVVSIPRDTMVNIPSCKHPDGNWSQPQRAQFNWAFSIGSDDSDMGAATACTWQTVEKFSGIKLDAYVLVDFSGFRQMVNSLGGVDIFLEQPLHDRSAGLELNAGCQHMDGEIALKFARAREGLTDGSDLSRIKRQHYLLSLMARTALNKSFVSDLPQLYQFVREGLRSLTVSPAISHATTLAGLAYSMKDIDPTHIRFITAPVGPDIADPNRVAFIQPLAGDVWHALQTDTQLPDGLAVRDGSGNEYISSSKTPTPDKPSSSSSQSSPDAQPTPLPSEVEKVPEASAGVGPKRGQEDTFAKQRSQCEP